MSDDTEDSGIREGRNANIGDDVRARALKFVNGGDSEDSPKASPARRTASKPVSRPLAKATDTGDETDRLVARKPASRGMYGDANRSLVDGVKSVARSIGDKVSSMDSAMKSAVRGENRYASGGVVKRATVKNLGKACK